MTDEHKLKLSKAAKLSNSSRVLSEETIKKMSDAAKARPKLPMPDGMLKRKEHVFIEDIESKECCRCHEIKPLAEFGKNKKARWDGLTYDCKKCRNIRSRNEYHLSDRKPQINNYAVKRRREAKIKAVEYKGNKCQDCGIEHIANYNTSIFQFHHRDPNEKDFAVSQINMRSFDNFKQELDKCDLLCANCHHILHWSLKEDI